MNELYKFISAPQTVCYDCDNGNNNDAYIPEHWAMESIMILEEEMVMSKLVHRDFNDQVQQYGDVVNTRQPSKFYSSRKKDCHDVEEQSANSTNVRVPLDQHHYATFVICDGEASKSFKDLKTLYLEPAVQAVGRAIDRSVMGQVHRFFGGQATGRLNGLSAANARQQLVQAQQQLTSANVPMQGRNLILSPQSYASLLNTDLFVAVNQSGNDNALCSAKVGCLFGFDAYSANNVPCSDKSAVASVSGTVTGAISAGSAATTQPVTITGYEVQVGDYAIIEGNDQPQYVVAATVGGGDTTDITLDSGSKFSTAAGAVVTVYTGIVSSDAQPIGACGDISVVGDLAPGQIVSTGVGATRKSYTIIESRPDPATPGNTLVLFDRPLEMPIAAGETVFPGPSGCFNLAFHRDSIAFVNRPLQVPNRATGAMGASMSYNDLSLRVVMQYDSKCQGTRVTVDSLSGVALLDRDLGQLFLG